MNNKESFFESGMPESYKSFSERTGGGIDDYSCALARYRSSLLAGIEGQESRNLHKEPTQFSLFDVNIEEVK